MQRAASLHGGVSFPLGRVGVAHVFLYVEEVMSRYKEKEECVGDDASLKRRCIQISAACGNVLMTLH